MCETAIPRVRKVDWDLDTIILYVDCKQKNTVRGFSGSLPFKDIIQYYDGKAIKYQSRQLYAFFVDFITSPYKAKKVYEVYSPTHQESPALIAVDGHPDSFTNFINKLSKEELVPVERKIVYVGTENKLGFETLMAIANDTQHIVGSHNLEKIAEQHKVCLDYLSDEDWNILYSEIFFCADCDHWLPLDTLCEDEDENMCQECYLTRQ